MVGTGSTPRSIHFLAREHELERARARLETTQVGEGGIIVLDGPPGIGVSSLAIEIAKRAASAGFRVVTASCVLDPLGRPYSGLADALEQLARTEAPDVLAADLGVDAGPISRLCPAISTLLPTIAPAVPLDPADERIRLSEALSGWLRRVATRQPLLITLDDAAEAGPDLVALLSRVLLRLRDAPALFVLGRGGLVPGAEAAADAERVEVSPLDYGAVAALIAQLAAVPLREELVALVAGGSSGNPLFATELYRHLVDEFGAADPDAELAAALHAVRGGDHPVGLDQRAAAAVLLP